MFISFEGIEGCGKTTQIKRLEKRLRAQGLPVVVTLEPGGTGIGRVLRELLLDSRNKNLAPLAELMLYAADRAQHVEEVIRPALDRGSWVLCDRFCDATVAYQGTARGQDRALIQFLNEQATRGARPDLTFWLDCPVEIGLARAQARDRAGAHPDQDRFEQEAFDFHERVRAGYAMLAQEDPRRFLPVDAAGAADEVERAVFQHLEPLVKTARERTGP